METKLEQDAYHKILAAELQFSFDMPACQYELSGEGE
jgi:hypothetical protein